MSGLPIDPDDVRFRLGVEDMNLRSELIASVNALARANQAHLRPQFAQFIEHTEGHFKREEQWITKIRH